MYPLILCLVSILIGLSPGDSDNIYRGKTCKSSSTVAAYNICYLMGWDIESTINLRAHYIDNHPLNALIIKRIDLFTRNTWSFNGCFNYEPDMKCLLLDLYHITITENVE